MGKLKEQMVEEMKSRNLSEMTIKSYLRVSKLKISDIDSKRMMVRIEQGKGKKDRYTTLSMKLLETLREYWKVYRPTSYLFTAHDKNQPLGLSVTQVEFRKAKKKPVY